jgi:hypothetical protein
MTPHDEPDDERAREAQAEELQREIDEVVAGKPPPEPPHNLREAFDRAMAERRKKKQKPGDQPPPG